MSQAIITFVKNPVLGKVKTRLARSIGAKQALEVYRQLCIYTKSVLNELTADVFIYYATKVLAGDLWDGFEKEKQYGGDLGIRMANAFQEQLAKYQKVLIIGSDCPQLKAAHLEAAFRSLDVSDIVIGPTFDGGYYLLGMTVDHSFLFDNMPWSTSKVFHLTIVRALEKELSVTQLQTLSDVDVQEDMKYL